MAKKVLVILVTLLFVTACRGSSANDRQDEGRVVESRGETYEAVTEVIERGTSFQDVSFSQSQILPPYGVHVTAEQAVLELQIKTSQNDAPKRSEDIQLALTTIASLAAENGAITLAESSVERVNGSYPRSEGSAENVQNLNTSTINLKLTTPLSSDNDFVESVAAFNTFLSALDLPDTLTVQALSVETEITDIEAIRQQIIAQVYQELDAVQGEHGAEVMFEISGLYEPLKQIQLSDVDYYLYLEPIVTVSEF